VIGAPLLRIRSDEQLVSMFRSGNEDAFRAIHDRYRPRLVAYTRQMLAGSTADAEDAVQEIFVRAYSGLRASRRELALRAWLYRVAHNRCIDELRRPQTVPTEEIPAMAAGSGPDPVAQTEQRDALRRLIADVQRLPDQQRSALLMRELGGMTYADVSGALGVSVPAVKSLLVRARIGLAQANEARDTACARIREDLIESHDRGVRASGLARRHMRDCPGCRQFRCEVRGVSRQLSVFVPALGPVGVIAKLLGLGSAGGGGAAAGSSAVAGSSAAAATGAAASAGAIAGAGHVVTLLAAAVVTAGGALELQHTASHAVPHAHHHRAPAHVTRAADIDSGTPSGGVAVSTAAAIPATAAASATSAAPSAAGSSATPATAGGAATATHARRHAQAMLDPSLVEKVDPDMYYVAQALGAGSSSTTSTPSATGTTPTTPAGTSGTGSASPAAAGSTSSATPSSSGSSSVTGTTSASSTPANPGAASTPATPSAPQGSASTGDATTPSSSTAGSATVAPATTKASASFGHRTHRSSTGARGRRIVAVFTMTGN
jgi:RNA polymerase sigma factor (sigma-70 family)